MSTFDYILCSGSGNRFLLFDESYEKASGIDTTSFVQKLSQHYPIDGVLWLCRTNEGALCMRMFNTDGSEAQMCGNGIRCVARLAHERYPHEAGASFTIFSGGRPYQLSLQEPILNNLPTYGVEIPVTMHSAAFPRSLSEDATTYLLPELDTQLYFAFLSLGNPHIVADVSTVAGALFDVYGRLTLSRLAAIGAKANTLRELFPEGVNVSLYCKLSQQRIFVATYERGVGLTPSCGTAMTSCATAAAVCGSFESDRVIEVWNRGGRVRAIPMQISSGKWVTRLIGNATFERQGQFLLSTSGEVCPLSDKPWDDEQTYKQLAEVTARDMNEYYALQIGEYK